MIEKGRSFTVKGICYEILESDSGELTLYQVCPNGEKVKANLTKDIIIELSKLVDNPKKKNNSLKKVILPRRLIAVALSTLALSSVVTTAIITGNLKLNKNYKRVSISDNNESDFYSMIRQNQNISAKLKPFVRYYAERMTEVYPDYDNINDNLKDIVFEENNNYFDTSKENVVAVYLSDNRIVYDEDCPIYNFTNHELLHSSSPEFSNSGKDRGEAIIEGITAQLEWELFGTKAYAKERNYAKMLSLILGGDELSDIYYNGKFSDLEVSVSKYCDMNQLEEIILLSNRLHDKENNSYNDSEYDTIYKFLIDTYFEKVNTDIISKANVSLDEYACFIDESLKFANINLDKEVDKYFNDKLNNCLSEMDKKFDNISMYNENSIIKGIKERYNYLEDDEISYISGKLVYHFEAQVNRQKDNSEHVELSKVVGANMDYVVSYPDVLPDNDIATVTIYNTDGSVSKSFKDVDYFIDEAMTYNSSLEQSETEEFAIRYNGCEYSKPNNAKVKKKVYSVNNN